MDNFEKTAYETNPVSSPADAICALVEAYDALQKILGDGSGFAAALRTAMYQPVSTSSTAPPLSIYEIGMFYVPEKKVYGIVQHRLQAALAERENDIRLMLVQENGILPRLCHMLEEFLENEPDQELYLHALRFYNECRRTLAIW
ncbi:MAG: hypothetical protein FWG87_12475 [Defluviitaleaceae bacterium]|nr:hypothetical protein [Defluviitaleaceae bacterium]